MFVRILRKDELVAIRTFDGCWALVNARYERQRGICNHVVACARIPFKNELVLRYSLHINAAHYLPDRSQSNNKLMNASHVSIENSRTRTRIVDTPSLSTPSSTFPNMPSKCHRTRSQPTPSAIFCLCVTTHVVRPAKSRRSRGSRSVYE